MLLSSCKKEEPRKAVFAGIYYSTLDYHEFNPSLKVKLEFDSSLNTSYGVDSIDINSDGNFDLIIKQRIRLDNNPAHHITDSDFPYCRLTLKNGLEVATKNEIYYIGLGQTNNVDWADTIQYNSRIDTISEWTDPNASIWMWVVPPTGLWGSNGCWYNLTNAEKYIGLRMKINSRYKLGWIKVNEISRENILFISYAIEK